MKKLDVRLIDPQQKHQSIFSEITKLGTNESLMIINDHDPKPLRNQLNKLFGALYDWQYEEEGPKRWRVVISKNEMNLGAKTVGEWLSEDYRRSEIFSKYGIDFCCNGNLTLQQACENQKLDVKSVIEEFNNPAQQSYQILERYSDWDIDFLSEYIVQNHHKYVRKSTPEIIKYFNKVTQVHGTQHSELIKMASFFKIFSNELLAHLKKEEEFLFPFIKTLANNKTEDANIHKSLFDTVQNPIQRMIEEHDHAGHDMKTLNELSNNYTIPEDACPSYRYLFELLKEYEQDLHKHMHLENNILFPKAIKLEQQIVLS